MKILLLGCGSVGGEAAVQLAARHPDLRLILGDHDLAVAEALAARIGGAAQPLRVDVTSPESLRMALTGADLVFNAVGPFYKRALPIIDAAIAARVDYVDVNDDHDVAARLFLDSTYDARAREAGIKVLIGCGSTPGLSNMLARLAADQLDRVRSIRLCWVVPFFGCFFTPSVWDHLFHMVDGEVTQFLDGRYQKVAPFGGRRDVTFLPPFGTYPAYYSGHGEPVTLPRFISGVEEVTIRSYFFPQAGDDFMRQLVRMGFGSQQQVPGAGMSPFDFLIHYNSTDAGRAALTVPPDPEPFGFASQVEVDGERGGDRVRIVFEQHGLTEQATDPTSTCARVVLEEVIGGKVKGVGLLAPEGCIDPEPYVSQVIRETGAILHKREEVIRTACYSIQS